MQPNNIENIKFNNILTFFTNLIIIKKNGIIILWYNNVYVKYRK